MAGRREFVKCMTLLTTGVTGFACGGGSGGPLAPPAPAPRILRVALMDVGATIAVFDGDLLLAVTRLAETSVVAVSRTCTHMGCTVLLPAAAGQGLECPCHGSRFTITGTVVNGPAARPLPSYPARIEGQQVVITVS